MSFEAAAASPFLAHCDQPMFRCAVSGVGQPVELLEVLIDNVGDEAWLRFRFLAPMIGKERGELTFVDSLKDMEQLCNGVAMPYLEAFGLQADVIVITLMDRPVEFGASDPEATQYVEAFRASDAGCEIEGI